MTENTLSPFKQALLEVQLEQWRDLPAEEDIALQPSEEFLEKSRKLIEDAKRGNIGKMSTTLRRIILVAAILTALAITALAIPAVREGIIRFFTVETPTHYEFQFDPEQAASAPDRIEKVYRPTYIPEGYEENLTLVGIGVTAYHWTTEAGEYITFNQMVIPNDTEGPAPNAEDVDVATLNWNGYQVFCVYDEISMYYWTDNEYFYALRIPASVPTEEHYKVFSSIAVDENAVIPE